MSFYFLTSRVLCDFYFKMESFNFELYSKECGCNKLKPEFHHFLFSLVWFRFISFSLHLLLFYALFVELITGFPFLYFLYFLFSISWIIFLFQIKWNLYSVHTLSQPVKQERKKVGRYLRVKMIWFRKIFSTNEHTHQIKVFPAYISIIIAFIV